MRLNGGILGDERLESVDSFFQFRAVRIRKRGGILAGVHAQLAEVVYDARDVGSGGRTVGHARVALYHEADVLVFAAHIDERRLVLGCLHIFGHILVELGDIVPLAAFAVQSAGAEHIVVGSQDHNVVGVVVECRIVAADICEVEAAARVLEAYLQVVVTEAVDLYAMARERLDEVAVLTRVYLLSRECAAVPVRMEYGVDVAVQQVGESFGHRVGARGAAVYIVRAQLVGAVEDAYLRTGLLVVDRFCFPERGGEGVVERVAVDIERGYRTHGALHGGDVSLCGCAGGQFVAGLTELLLEGVACGVQTVDMLCLG